MAAILVGRVSLLHAVAEKAMVSRRTLLKVLLGAGVVLAIVLAFRADPRRLAGAAGSESPPDPAADVVKSFLRSRLGEKYVDPDLRASPEGREKTQEWSNQLKREYAGVYVPQYAAPAVAQDPRNQRHVASEDITIQEMLPLRVKAIAPLRYEVAASLTISSEAIRFRVKYLYATVSLVRREKSTYVADFQVVRLSDWAPWSPQGKDEQERLESGAP